MKQIRSTLLLIAFSLMSFMGRSESSTSGFLLFGKNKTEGVAICTQQGICKLQQMEDSTMIPVRWIATLVDAKANTYRISFTFNYDSLISLQPDQERYFNSGSVYPCTEKFVFPAWLLTGLGFNAAYNKGLTIDIPFDLGIPLMGPEGVVAMTFSKTVTIAKAAPRMIVTPKPVPSKVVSPKPAKSTASPKSPVKHN